MIGSVAVEVRPKPAQGAIHILPGRDRSSIFLRCGWMLNRAMGFPVSPPRPATSDPF